MLNTIITVFFIASFIIIPVLVMVSGVTRVSIPGVRAALNGVKIAFTD